MPASMMNDCLFTPDWPLPPNVRSAFSLRTGGVSGAPYDSLNLGDHVGDDLMCVSANRMRYAQALGCRPVYLKQVHGWELVQIEEGTPDGTQADACFTLEPAIACTIMVADCLPVLFCRRDGRIVGAAHAGWRGLCGGQGIGVIEVFLRHFQGLSLANTAQSAIESVANDWLVWLGPCIGPSAFEVGAEVRDAFVSANADANVWFESRPNGKYFANLPMLARQRLAVFGIQDVYGNDGSEPWCTVINSSRFFSHRRDRVSGRFAASIWIT